MFLLMGAISLHHNYVAPFILATTRICTHSHVHQHLLPHTHTQRHWHGYCARKNYAAARMAISRVQAIWRGRNARATFEQTRRMHAALAVQVCACEAEQVCACEYVNGFVSACACVCVRVCVCL
jgi:myosin heavy subunit